MTRSFTVPNMNHQKDIELLVKEYGYIAWRRGSDNNVEVVDVRSVMPDRGRLLLKEMYDRLQQNPPWAVFGFCRSNNTKSIAWYTRMGFQLANLPRFYQAGGAVLFWSAYSYLLSVQENFDVM